MKPCRPAWWAYLSWALVYMLAAAAVADSDQLICRDAGHTHALAPASSDEQPPPRQFAPDRRVDILHLKLDVTPDFDRQTVAGTATITFSPIGKPLRELRLDAIDLTIHRVRSDAGVDDFASSREDLTIVFSRELAVDEKVSVEIQYEAQPRKGLYFRTPAMGYAEGDTHLWTQGEPHEAPHWYPCYDYPNERSSTEIICRVPREMTVLSNGKMVAQWRDDATGLKAVRWVQEKPHVNYLVCLVAGHFRKLEERHGDLALEFYTQPSLYEHAANSFRDTKKIMEFFEREIGIPYPWDKYAQVTVVESMFGGMENTSITTLTERTIFTSASENIRSSRGLDAHELAHQWFGNLVTCKDWTHLWLNEGFATFYTHLYEGHRFGRDHMLYGLYRDANNRIFRARGDTRPIAFRGYKTAREQFDYRAYPKGSWVLHMLRSRLGDDLYRQCIRTYLERHAFTSVVTEDLNKIVEELSGRSFDVFFDQWVYHGGQPELAVSFQWLAGQNLAKVTIRQTHEVNDKVLLFTFPTKLRFIVAGRVIDHAIEIDRAQQDFFIPLPASPDIVRFDPDFTVLAKVSFDKPQEMLLAQLENREDVIGRLLAVEALAERKTSKAVEALARALREDPFFGVRLAASEALAKIRTDEAYDALHASMAQDDARVRQRVVRDVGSFYRDETLAILARVMESEHNPEIKADAIEALGRFHGQPSRDILRRYLASDSFRNQLADTAVAAIRAQDDEAFTEDLIRAIRERGERFTPGGMGRAVETLGRVARHRNDKDEVRRFILEYVHNPRESVRTAAVTALGELGDIKAAPVLESFAAGPTDDRQSEAARRALRKLRETTPLTPAELVELREVVAELRKSNQKLRESVDELQARFDAQKPETTTVAGEGRD